MVAPANPNWFDPNDYPFFKTLLDEIGDKVPPLFKKDINKKPHIIAIATATARASQFGEVELQASILDYVKLLKTAPEEPLAEIGQFMSNLTQGEKSVMEMMVEFEQKARRLEISNWGVYFEGRQVNVYYNEI